MKIRFAVVGLGHIGRRHADLIAVHPRAELVATCDLDAGAARVGVPHYTDYESMLRSTECTVVCVCTPNGLHADQVIAALRAGANVVVEKPVALTVKDCDRIAVAARRHGGKVFGVMQNRYSPASTWLKKIMDGQKLGKILQVHLDCFWNRDHRYYRKDGVDHPWHGDPDLDGGVLFTQFAHFIDLLCWTCGPAEVLTARFANQRHAEFHSFADTGMAHFSLATGGIGSLNFTTTIWDRNFESTFTVIGEKGTVKLGGQYMNEVRYCHAENVDFPELPATALPNDYGGYQGSAANHHFVIDNVINTLEGQDRIATTLAEGRRVVALIEAIYRAG